MSRVSFGEFVLGSAVKVVLDRIQRPGGPAPAPRALPRQAAAREEPRPRRLVVPLALLGVGLVAMVPFESAVTRVIGVLALFGFVVAGAFAIADPRWLGSAPDLDDGARASAGPDSGYRADQ
jgi:hypothetical protein